MHIIIIDKTEYLSEYMALQLNMEVQHCKFISSSIISHDIDGCDSSLRVFAMLVLFSKFILNTYIRIIKFLIILEHFPSFQFSQVYAATPLIHRAVTTYTIDELKSDSIYEVGIYFIPFPGQTTELQAHRTIQIRTSIENGNVISARVTVAPFFFLISTISRTSVIS